MTKTTKTSKNTAAKAADVAKAAAKKKTVAKKTIVRKTTAKKAPTRKVLSKKKAASTTNTRIAAVRKGLPRTKAISQITAVERHAMIAEAAYLRAESQGFISDATEDWLLSETEIDARLEKAGVRITG
jgi:hypothetical protein